MMLKKAPHPLRVVIDHINNLPYMVFAYIARGHHSAAILAQTQPQPDEQSLLLPYLITWRPTWRYRACLGLLLGIPAGLLLAILTPMVLSILGWNNSIHWASIQEMWLGGVIGFLLGQLFAFRMSLAQQLKVTEEELAFTADNYTQHLAWTDIDMFGVMGETKLHRFPLLQYILSGSVLDIKWGRIQRINWWMEPDQPFADYEEDMNDLLALIAAKTGLSLYELEG